MNQPPAAPVPDALAEAVDRLVTDTFSLRDELRTLDRVCRADAPVAAIAYCARIQEALTAEALRELGLEPEGNLFVNLLTLEQLDLLPAATRCFGHGLRRLANDARHVLRRITPTDGGVACLYAERWLDWYFFTFLGLKPHTDDPLCLASFRLAPETGLARVLRQVEQGAAGPGEVADELLGDAGTIPATPVPFALLAEMLFDRGADGDAGRVIEEALGRFPDDGRLRQLRGLHLSRAGRPAEAVRWLEPLASHCRDDEELLGILGGAYKRCWRSAPDDRRSLEAAHRTYRRGWEKSRWRNVYLGINTATTALLLGQRELARRLADEVRGVVNTRESALASRPGAGSRAAASYWSLVTGAEAELLTGRLEIARGLYLRAFRGHAEKVGARQSTLDQLPEILRAMGLPPDAEAFLNDAPAEQRPGA